MAIRRAKQKAQVIQKLAQVAPPGETFIACVHVETGPSPWLNAAFDEVPLLGLIVAFSRRFYFLTLTNTSVVVNKAGMWSNRPKEVVGVYPRHAVPIANVKLARVWSSVRLVLPGHAKPSRLNVHRVWRRELEQLLAGLQAGAVPGQAQGQPQFQGQPQPQYQGQPQVQGPPQQYSPQQPYPGRPVPGQQQAGQQPYPGQPYPGQQPTRPY